MRTQPRRVRRSRACSRPPIGCVAALGRSEILVVEIPELGDRPPPLHVGDVWSPGNRPHLGADQSPAISPGAPSVTTSSGSASPSMRWADVYVPHVSPASMAMGRRPLPRARRRSAAPATGPVPAADRRGGSGCPCAPITRRAAATTGLRTTGSCAICCTAAVFRPDCRLLSARKSSATLRLLDRSFIVGSRRFRNDLRRLRREKRTRHRRKGGAPDRSTSRFTSGSARWRGYCPKT